MSVDKWIKCPACHGCSKYPDGIDEIYGNISFGDFLNLQEKMELANNKYTLHINCEMCIKENKYMSINIFANCSVCGMSWTLMKDDIEGSK